MSPRGYRAASFRIGKKKAKVPLNAAQTQKLDIYVFGSGEYGELGLGSVKRNMKTPTNVRRPRLNDLLDAETVGIVQLDVGGMHCVALTHDNKIYTWGVNDNGALGRDTMWRAPEVEIDDVEEEDNKDDMGMNPLESTPEAIPADAFDEGVIFVQVAATDSASFALTDDGQVYGWGTFRVSIL
jgi:regulator of chromosome condensation